jgi:superfamily II DNA/RNA helicase
MTRTCSEDESPGLRFRAPANSTRSADGARGSRFRVLDPGRQIPHPAAGHGSGPGKSRSTTHPQESTLPVAETFTQLGLPDRLLAALAAEGVTVPFPIQAATLPNALAGRDVLGRGRTGSGKTLAYGLPLLARLDGRRAQPRQPLALVLVPTRELARQVTGALAPFARALRLRLATVVGGMSVAHQAKALRNGAEVVVATPGHLKNLIDRGDCHLHQVAVTVLDGADHMADTGFMPQVTALLDQVAPGGQRLLFSATQDHDVDLLICGYLHDPAVYSPDLSADGVTGMQHHLPHTSTNSAGQG